MEHFARRYFCILLTAALSRVFRLIDSQRRLDPDDTELYELLTYAEALNAKFAEYVRGLLIDRIQS